MTKINKDFRYWSKMALQQELASIKSGASPLAQLHREIAVDHSIRAAMIMMKAGL